MHGVMPENWFLNENQTLGVESSDCCAPVDLNHN